MKRQGLVRGIPAEAPPGIETSWEWIDRAIGLQFKATSIGNRNLSESKICLLVKRILSGKWQPAIAALHFDCDGHLVNGFHRVEAIIRADVKVLCEIKRGVPRETVFDMDTGKPRSGADVLRITEPGKYT